MRNMLQFSNIYFVVVNDVVSVQFFMNNSVYFTINGVGLFLFFGATVTIDNDFEINKMVSQLGQSLEALV